MHQRLGLLGLAALALAACGPTVTTEAASGSTSGSGSGVTTAASGGSTTTSAGSSGTSTASTGGAGGGTGGGGPGACQPPVDAADAPGMYFITSTSPVGKPTALVKRDDANDRCLMLFVNLGVGVAYGIEPSAGFGIEKVVLTNSAADCALPPALLAPPAGQWVEATCGAGSLFIELGEEDSVYGQIVNASFEFPPTYPWVPATDTFCVVQNCCNPYPVSGC